MNAGFSVMSHAEMVALVNKRPGETKLGETISTLENYSLEQLSNTPARFVLLGIPEDTGVMANAGIAGSPTAWPAFLKSFLNIQDNEFLQGTELLLLGAFSFPRPDTDDVQVLREATAHIDEQVYPLIRDIVSLGKIPLVIGGGHNNAFPLIKGCAAALGQGVNAINLDAHSDFRALEGRHSGNGFSYAFEQQFLNKYAMLGLHEAYNSRAVLGKVSDNSRLLPLFWEDMFLRNKYSWQSGLEKALAFVADRPFGVELDLDTIERALSSAMSPLGISATYAAAYLYKAGRHPQAMYLHLPEAVASRSDGHSDILTGKLLSYLLQSFIKGVKDRE
jgi:formiminoglutamase